MSDRNCLSCRSCFAIPNMANRYVCRRVPPQSFLVGSTNIAGTVQPVFQTAFPSVDETIYCDEYKTKLAAVATVSPETGSEGPGCPAA